MQYSDKYFNMPDFIQEFKTIEKHHNKIKHQFSQSVNSIIQQHYQYTLHDEILSELLDQYANHIINATSSVIDKDLSYPEYRLKEELERMYWLTQKRNLLNNQSLLFEKIHQNSKTFMVHHFPGILNLSGNGFRLLEANALFYDSVFEYDLNDYISRNSI